MDQRLSLQFWQLKLQSMPWVARAWVKAPLVVMVLMTIILAKLSAQISWQIVSPVSMETKTSTGTISQSQSAPTVNLAEAVNAHLFGKLAPTANKGPISAPITRLKLTLHGVFASENTRLAMAIISDAGGQQKYYHIGDAVPGGARLHAIYTDRVILDRQGKLETLKLPREVAAFNTLASPATVSNQSGRNGQLPVASARVHRLHASEQVKQLRETMLKSPQDIWKQVRIEPVMVGGNIEGYRFAHKDKALMQSLGLTPDDVILEINGMTLTDPAVLYDVMSQITTTENVSLTIKRKGQTETIEITM